MTAGAEDVSSLGGAKSAVSEHDADENVDKWADSKHVLEDSARSAQSADVKSKRPRFQRWMSWSKLLAFGVLPALALILASGAAFLKWQDSSMRYAEMARIESVKAAKDSTIAMLSYRADTVDQQLAAAADGLTGQFRDSYRSLTADVVIPAAKQKHISAVASVPAVASVSANADHAVVLVFVNQTVVVGDGGPTDTASSVRVTLDKVGNRWLVSGFEPI
ncbi:MAG: Mce-associated rane protein [Mycobacterium sp.]|nr:Mce-associated rane protein [Mycobacterium sp.]